MKYNDLKNKIGKVFNNSRNPKHSRREAIKRYDVRENRCSCIGSFRINSMEKTIPVNQEVKPLTCEYCGELLTSEYCTLCMTGIEEKERKEQFKKHMEFAREELKKEMFSKNKN